MRATVRPRATELHDPDRTLLEFEVDAGPQARIGIGRRSTASRPKDATRSCERCTRVPRLPYEPPEIAAGLADYVAEAAQARALPGGRVVPPAACRGRDVRRPDHQPRRRSQGDRRFPRRSAAAGQAGRARADRARGFGRRRPDRGLHSAHQELSESAGILEGGRRRSSARKGPARSRSSSPCAAACRTASPMAWRSWATRTVTLEQLRPALAKLQANDVFVESNLSAAVSAIAGMYQRLGFARAKVAAAANELNPSAAGQGLVRPVITITEGPLTLVGDVMFDGQAIVPEEQLRAVVKSAPGALVLPAAGRGRLRRGAARISQSWIRRRQRRRRPRGCRRMARAPT